MKWLLIILTIIFSSCHTEDKAIHDADSNSDESNFTEVNTQQHAPELGEKIINYAATLKGTPYKVAGRDTTGFDCSGFIYYVFKRYHVEVPHSSRHLAEMGTEVDTSTAKPGDLVFFKGANPYNSEVGHVGIVVSSPGQPVKFIHASSATSSAYVKYDSLASPNYKRRFLKVKRLLTDVKQ